MQKINLYISELLGALLLVFFGCGAFIIDSLYGGIGHAGVAASFGIIVMVLIYAFGNVSGAHFNPAVSFGFLLAGRIRLSTFVPYTIAQTLGALLAGAILMLLFPDASDLGTTVPSVSVFSAFLFETIFSFILMLIILNVSTHHMEKGIMAGVAVGSTIFLLAFLGGKLTGASMNPARTIGPAIFSMKFTHIWIYLTAPFAGTALASPLCKIIQQDECCRHERQ